ncbi:glycosyltransferase family 2 protein [Hyunsoonleella ulvae]|uniref:glycosyltransferase family 2 protein n=1 Tax=Hyunsoonleella ulvae TaxID=2799948 RepID=UPI00193ACD6B|nr:glycosyltransferase [Hyunsoonleella ulvae]
MLISIIIPVYNAEKYIERCVNSIVEQTKTFQDVELIIINDGSKDGSTDLLKELAKKNQSISLHEQENSGEGATRNTGLQLATGKYIWFIDADDYIDTGIFSSIYNVVKQVKPEMVVLSYKTVNPDGSVVSRFRLKDKTYTRNELIEASIFNNNVWSKVISRKLIASNKITFDPSLKTATDFDFSLRTIFYSKKIVTLKEAGYNYVIVPTSISNIRTNEHLERLANDSVIVLKNLTSFLDKNESSFPGSKAIFTLWLDNFVYGLLFSLFRFRYNTKFINGIIDKLKTNNNYPIKLSKNKSFLQRMFILIANNKETFLIACKIKRLITR